MAYDGVREAAADQLVDWDDHAVRGPGGNVHQSLAWARYQSGLGYEPRFLVADDDRRILVLMRRWPFPSGARAYIPRGPISAGDAPAAVADRLDAVAHYLGQHGADIVASDAEMAAESGYADAIRRCGFRPAEELQPSRHRLSVPLGAVTEAAAFAALSASSRQHVRFAAKHGLRAVCSVVDDQLPAHADIEINRIDAVDNASLRAAVHSLYIVVAETAARRHFAIVAPERFSRWATMALCDRLGLLIEIRSPEGQTLGSALFHRHGRRLTYFIAGDSAANRRRYPGVMNLLVWRAIQLAIALDLDELDLGGADVRGMRRRPLAGEAMHGVLAFKESFGARWIDLTGNHARVLNSARYAAGSLAERVGASVPHRSPRSTPHTVSA
jgi:hypothetical protein